MVELAELVEFKVGHSAEGNTGKGTNALGQEKILAGEGGKTLHTPGEHRQSSWGYKNWVPAHPTQFTQ